MMKLQAIQVNNTARHLMARGSWQEAEQGFIRAAELAPHWSVPWSNLTLLYKQQRKWHKSLECSQRAVQLKPGDKASWWNLGLAATAVGNWQEARRAWLHYGLTIPPGDDPPTLDLGLSAIRVDLGGTAEIVWCSRLDPARTMILSVPSPASRRRFGDILLNDGLALGYRLFQGRRISIFDELAVLIPSTFATYEVIIADVAEVDRVALVDLAEKHEIGIQEWATTHRKRPPVSAHASNKRSFYSSNQVTYHIAARSVEEINHLFQKWHPGRQGCSLQHIKCILAAFDGIG
jgi:hypothetical protein